MKTLNTPAENRAERLVAVVTAYTMTEDMVATTRRQLTDHVKGIRLLVRAGEQQAASECVSALRNTFNGVTGGPDVSVVDWQEVVVRHCDGLLHVLKS